MKQYIFTVFKAVKEHYGPSKHFDCYPALEVIDDCAELLAGEFRDDCIEIMINLHNLRHLSKDDAREEICRTITHEYIHYMQNPVIFEKLKKAYDYWSNPYELEAYAREDEILETLLEL